MNDKDNSSTPPIYDHQPRVTCAHTHKHASVLGGSYGQKMIALYYMEKRKDASLMIAGKAAIRLKVTHNQTGRRICTGEGGEGVGHDLIM